MKTICYPYCYAQSIVNPSDAKYRSATVPLVFHSCGYIAFQISEALREVPNIGLMFRAKNFGYFNGPLLPAK